MGPAHEKKPHHTSLVPWGAENVSSSAAPKAEEPSVCTGVVVLCIPVVKWGWIYKLDLLCSLLHFGSPQAEANPSSQAAAQGCWLSFALPWKCPKFWLQRFPVGFSPCQEGSGSLTGTSRDFPWGKSFPLGLLCPEPWLPAAPGSWLGPERSEEWEILLNQELNWLLSMRKVETPQHPADGPAEKAKLKI